MVDMQLSNNKLLERGEKMLVNELNIDQKTASNLLRQFGSVRNAIQNYKK
jgi:N-acetylmuramic acid 6-phosphate etherase